MADSQYSPGGAYTTGTGIFPLSQLTAVIEERDPTSFDVNYPQGKEWINKISNQVFVLTSFSTASGQKQATWTPLGNSSGVVATINGVSPVLGNINLIDQGGAGAITITPGAPPDVGISVNVDGTTIQIVGDQLVAAGTVTGSGTTVGAVTTDIITIPLGAVAAVTSYDILVAGNNTTDGQGVGYSLFGTVRTNGAAASLQGTVDKISNENAGSVAADANLVVSGNNAIVRVLGIAAKTINWSAILRSVTV